MKISKELKGNLITLPIVTGKAAYEMEVSNGPYYVDVLCGDKKVATLKPGERVLFFWKFSWFKLKRVWKARRVK